MLQKSWREFAKLRIRKEKIILITGVCVCGGGGGEYTIIYAL